MPAQSGEDSDVPPPLPSVQPGFSPRAPLTIGGGPHDQIA